MDDFERSMFPQGENLVEQTFQKQKAELNSLERRDVAALMLENCAVDLMEMFSPKRFAERAGACGLRPGLAIDWEEGWDMDKRRTSLR